jgi:hypothetical protein
MSRTCIPRCQPGWIGTLPECVPISRRVPVRDGEAGTGAGARQRPAGATFRDSAACPRLAKGSDDPRLFRGRPAQRNRPAIVLNRRSPTPRHPSRPTGERRPVAPRYPAAARRAQRNRDSVPRYLTEAMMSPAPFRFPRSIATVSLAGTLPEKLEAAGSVGFDSIRAFRERPVDLLCLPDRGKGVVNAAKHHTRWATSFPRPGRRLRTPITIGADQSSFSATRRGPIRAPIAGWTSCRGRGVYSAKKPNFNCRSTPLCAGAHSERGSSGQSRPRDPHARYR